MTSRPWHIQHTDIEAHHGCRGFTLIEVLMCIAILSIVFGTICQTFDTFNRAYTTENVVAGVQQKTRNGVEFMVHDIRLAGLDPLGTAGAGFLAAGARPLFNLRQIPILMGI